MVELLGTHSTQMSFHGVGASGIQTECIISQVSVCVCVSNDRSGDPDCPFLGSKHVNSCGVTGELFFTAHKE